MKTAIQRLSDATPPIMPETGRKLHELLQTDTTRSPQLQAVLLSDPAAAIAVFRQLEKTRPGAFDRVADPAHAVSLMGQDAFRHLLESLPVADADRQPDPRAIGRADAYSQAAHAAIYAGHLCTAAHTDVTDEIHTAALLQQPALLALWTLDPPSAKRAAYAIRDGMLSETVLSAELGESPAELNRALAESWALPMLVRQALSTADTANKKPQLVRLADQLAEASAAGWQHEQLDRTIEPLADFLRLEPDKAITWLHRHSVDAARQLFAAGYPLTAFNLAALPGKMADDDLDNHKMPLLGVKKAASKPGKAAAAKPAPGNDLQSTLATVMRRIREDAGAGRVVFAMLNKDRSRLRTRLALGGDPQDGLRKLDLDITQKNLFTLMMAKPQSIWLNRGNAKKLQAYLPGSLRKLVGPGGAYMISLFVKNRPLGLLYGDGQTLNEQGFKQFCALAHEATTALTAGSRSGDKSNA